MCIVWVVSENSTKLAGESYIWFSLPADDGTAVVIAADGLADSPGWLVALAFKVGGMRTRLIGHSVIERPTGWPEKAETLALSLARLFEPNNSDEYLTTAIVRSAATTELEMRVRRIIVERRLPWLESHAETAWGDAVTPGEPDKRTRPRRKGDLLRARVAERYVEVLGNTAKPKVALAAEMGYAVNTINRYLFDARERGFLTSHGQGRSGGDLTDLAKAILAEGEGRPEQR